MELLSVFRHDNQRQYITQLLPGMIASWPLAYLLVSFVDLYTKFKFSPDNSVQLIFLLSLFVLVSFGMGTFLEDIGSLVEIRLEQIYFNLKTWKRKNLKDWDNGLNPRSLLESTVRHTFAFILIFIPSQPMREWLLGCHLNEHTFDTPKAAKDNFYSNWDQYLKLTFKDNQEAPVALRYYRSVLVRFKFQINVCLAFLVMLIGHFIIKLRELGMSDFLTVFGNKDTWLYLGAVCATVSILLVEAFKLIELLDEIRYRLIQTKKDNNGA